MNSTPSEPDLTFHWPVEKGFSYVLYACIAGSMLVHGITFFLFQVVYPQRVTIQQPAPQLSLLTASSPESAALLRWIEAEDPALIASYTVAPPPALMEVRYRPSFASPRTAPLGAPADKLQDVQYPPAVDRLTSTDRLAAPTSPPPVASQSRTAIRFTGVLAARPLARNPPVDVGRRAATPIQPTVLLVGVDAGGGIRFPFLQQTSGDVAFDELAVDHLRRITFAPAKAAITWGYATFAWGADAYRVEPAKAE